MSRSMRTITPACAAPCCRENDLHARVVATLRGTLRTLGSKMGYKFCDSTVITAVEAETANPAREAGRLAASYTDSSIAASS
jgi:hypothetical protein